MKRFLIALPFVALTATSSFALEAGCNRAIQNWQNGSKDTCPVADSGSAARYVAEETVEERKHCYEREQKYAKSE